MDKFNFSLQQNIDFLFYPHFFMKRKKRLHSIHSVYIKNGKQEKSRISKKQFLLKKKYEIERNLDDRRNLLGLIEI